ncbi:hypothetical protein AHF37_07693 [Paragonimus kellicotti]|nr:hypothetical protein AHF37_07693 [Paragonimus kellicotti]
MLNCELQSPRYSVCFVILYLRSGYTWANTFPLPIVYLQSRINQCSVECADRARDKMVQDPTEEQIQTAKRQVLDCAKNCVENQLTTGLPALVSRLAHQLKKLKSDQLKLAP